jgi:nucleotide-binding universal stress UspA family protein
MFENVVAGIGDYEAGRDAVELAKALVSRDGRIALVHVEGEQSDPAPDSGAGPDRERQRFGLQRLRRLRDEAQVPAEVARIQAPSIRRGLHTFAVREAADLIVVGASRRNEVARMVLGDDVGEVLDDPPCAVAVAPAGYSARSTQMRNVGVAYDASIASEQALAVARNLAAERHATLSAFEAVPPPVYVGDEVNVEREAEEELEQTRQRIVRLGDVEPYADYADDAVEGLRRYGASVDLLVVGSHRHRAPDRGLHRRTSQRLAARPPSPLLVVCNGPARERR